MLLFTIAMLVFIVLNAAVYNSNAMVFIVLNAAVYLHTYNT
jgi:hypothetical protein